MLEGFKHGTARIGSQTAQEHPERIERGIFVQKEMPEYCREYDTIIANAAQGGS
jgi:2-oxoglutarate ferredoxin oxidoreductase subunit beta